MNNFKVLSYKEEEKLTIEEKKEYYKCLREYLKNIPVSNFKNIYLKICNVLNKKIVRIIIDKIKGYELVITGQENIPDTPVIYASTHQNFNDHFNAVLSIPDHAIILNTSTVTKSFKCIMGVNGIVYVDRNDKEDRFKSKMKLMKYTIMGKSIVVFPEGTYNCSPNKLHLPLHMGVIDISKKMQIPIVPLIQEYTYDDEILDGKTRVKKCRVHFGKPIYVNVEDDLKEKKEELSEIFSTIKYFLMEEKGLYKRENITIEEYINFVKTRINTWKMVNVDINDERKTIYGYNDDFYLFHHINDIAFNGNNELLETEHVRKLEKLYKTNLHKF